ncbi:hypothetical protein D9757_009536 [Collybiopsis confluens]|uniref:Uncharacterized protein n=1 Tax=Collybiopsis confluens TaxID=2823264 RepID=A0A8H5H8C1_9AGAR|nr:hypothetical protein D9757_009536 [Collybiopsis confluens]
MHTKFHSRFLILLIPSLILRVSAVCDEATFGIGNLQSLSNGTNRWPFFDHSCNTVHFVDLKLAQNPCTGGIFTCTPAPILFKSYINQTDKSKYTCEKDSTPEICNSVPISVCCSKEGSVDIITQLISTFATPPTSTLPNSISLTSPTSTLPNSISLTSPPSTSTSTSPPGVGGSRKHSTTAAVAGGILGGLAVLTLLISVTLVRCRRLQRATWKQRAQEIEVYAPGVLSTPYDVTIVPTIHKSEKKKSLFQGPDAVQSGDGGQRKSKQTKQHDKQLPTKIPLSARKSTGVDVTLALKGSPPPM